MLSEPHFLSITLEQHLQLSYKARLLLGPALVSHAVTSAAFCSYDPLESPNTDEWSQGNSVRQAPLSRDRCYRSLGGNKNLVTVAPCTEKFPGVPPLWGGGLLCVSRFDFTLSNVSISFPVLFSSSPCGWHDVNPNKNFLKWVHSTQGLLWGFPWTQHHWCLL